MDSVSSTEFRANLSRYLRQARQGGEIQILNRGKVVARIVPPKPELPVDGDDARQRLIAKGVLKPGRGNVARVLEKPPLNLGVSILEAVLEERGR